MTKNARPRAARLRWMAAVVVGGLAGVGVQRAWRYLRRMLKQPQLPPPAIQMAQVVGDIQAEAYAIAVRDLCNSLEVRSLASGEERTILCAGSRNFREPWARDTGFAVFGLLELGAARETREALEVFLLTQHESGQFPVKIHSTSILDRFVHSWFGRTQPIDQPIRPKYFTAHNTISLDGNGLLVIAIAHYAARTGDEAFVRENWEALERAMAWLEQHTDADGPLLKQGAFTDWADTISRTGKVLYTNVIYWKAVLDMGRMALVLGDPDGAQRYATRAEAVREEINREFWRSDLGYFVTSRFFDNLSSGGNLLAIAWGMADEDQSHRILDAMRFYGMAIPVPTKAVHRAYPRQFIAIENRLGGIADYHTYFAWLWLGAWHVIALSRLGRLEEAGELVYNMSRVIFRDGAVHEVYAPNGAFASSFWYTSESPLSWSAGMFVYACCEYRRILAAAGGEGKDFSGMV